MKPLINFIHSDVSDPIDRFFLYRNDASKDVDRSPNVMKMYWETGMMTSREKQEPDTFLASAYDTLRKLALKQNRNYYIQDFKKYVGDVGEDYSTISNTQAKRLRMDWFRLEKTKLTYSFMRTPSVIRYVHATHTYGNFVVLPKSYGGRLKAFVHKENPISYLSYLRENWEKVESDVDSLTFECYLKRMYLDRLFHSAFSSEDYAINFNESFEEIFMTMDRIVSLIEYRDTKIRNVLSNKM